MSARWPTVPYPPSPSLPITAKSPMPRPACGREASARDRPPSPVACLGLALGEQLPPLSTRPPPFTAATSGEKLTRGFGGDEGGVGCGSSAASGCLPFAWLSISR